MMSFMMSSCNCWDWIKLLLYSKSSASSSISCAPLLDWRDIHWVHSILHTHLSDSSRYLLSKWYVSRASFVNRYSDFLSVQCAISWTFAQRMLRVEKREASSSVMQYLLARLRTRFAFCNCSSLQHLVILAPRLLAFLQCSAVFRKTMLTVL